MSEGCPNFARAVGPDWSLRATECHGCKYRRLRSKPQPPCQDCGGEIPKAGTKNRKRCVACAALLVSGGDVARQRARAYGPYPTVCVDCCGALPVIRGKVHGKTHRCQRCRAANKAESRQRRDKRIRAGFIETVNVRELGNRDRWVCQICRRKVNPKRVYPDRRSASIDHIVPVSEGGEHSYRNTQLAHLGCNREKFVQALGEQLRLVG